MQQVDLLVFDHFQVNTIKRLKRPKMFQEILDDRGYKYYINKTTKVKYKENPALIHLIQKIKANSSEIKYASYRSAMKLLQLKKSLYSRYGGVSNFMLLLTIFFVYFSVLHSISMRNFDHLQAQSRLFTGKCESKSTDGHYPRHLLRY